jgi:hypothetical protein
MQRLRALALASIATAACGDVRGSSDDAGHDLGSSPDAGPSAAPDDGGAADSGATPPQAHDSMTADAMIAICGDGAPASGAAIDRLPYLQQVSATSAMVGWTSTTTAPQHVVVTTPDGGAVTTVTSIIESTIVPSSSVQQRWATVSDLEPDTVYCYSLLHGSLAMTARAGFRTAPSPDSDQPVRFVAFGDSGTGSADQRAIRDEIMKVPHDLTIHVGDIAYSYGTIAELETRTFDVYAPLLRYSPVFPVAGDHEHETDEAAPFRAVFALPGNERWFSFDWGPIHFAAIDTDEDLALQAAWLDDDLAATDRAWKIVYLHEPPYSSGEHGSHDYVREPFAPIFEAHGVQLVFSGDDHDYERTTPQNGVTYIVTGGGGGGLRPVGESDFTAYAESIFHFVQVEVTGDELTLRAIDRHGDELDSVVIPREP